MTPTKIEIKDKAYVVIQWNNGLTSKIKLANLRKHCPCAVCQAENEKQSKTYIPIYNGDELTVTHLEVVGQYALKVFWKDGHDTGLYEFGFLKELSE